MHPPDPGFAPPTIPHVAQGPQFRIRPKVPHQPIISHPPISGGLNHAYSPTVCKPYFEYLDTCQGCIKLVVPSQCGCARHFHIHLLNPPNPTGLAEGSRCVVRGKRGERPPEPRQKERILEGCQNRTLRAEPGIVPADERPTRNGSGTHSWVQGVAPCTGGRPPSPLPTTGYHLPTLPGWFAKAQSKPSHAALIPRP